MKPHPENIPFNKQRREAGDAAFDASGDAKSDAEFDGRLATLLHNTPEAAVPVDLAHRAIALAAAHAPRPAALVARPANQWAFVMNCAAGVAIVMIVLICGWNLLPGDGSASTAGSNSISNISSLLSSLPTIDAVVLGTAAILVASGAQIVFSTPIASFAANRRVSIE